MNKVSCKKATSYVNKIGICVGEREICEMRKDHFKLLYNSVPDRGDRSMFQQNCVTVEDVNCNVTVRDIVDAVCAQSKRKSAGPNGLFMESFIYACPELWIHLSLFFTACIKHCFLPDSFMNVVITPLVKNKGGNLTDINSSIEPLLCPMLTPKFLKGYCCQRLRRMHLMVTITSLVSKLVTRLRCVLVSSKKLLIIILTRAAMCLLVL